MRARLVILLIPVLLALNPLFLLQPQQEVEVSEALQPVLSSLRQQGPSQPAQATPAPPDGGAPSPTSASTVEAPCQTGHWVWRASCGPYGEEGFEFYAGVGSRVAAVTNSGIYTLFANDSTTGIAMFSEFVSPSASRSLAPGTQLPGIVSFFLGDTQEQALPVCDSVSIINLWDGINLTVGGHCGALKTTFSLLPAASYEDIAYDWLGADSIEVVCGGKAMNATTACGNITDCGISACCGNSQIESSYQVDGTRVTYYCQLSGQPEGVWTIDPVVFASYLGGTGVDIARGVALDQSGGLIAAGYTASATFPATPGAYDESISTGYDAWCARFTPDGSDLVYATYIGGTGLDQAIDVECLANGTAYVVGQTESADFPATAGAFQTAFGGIDDAFLCVLSPDGSTLLYSTYLGNASLELGHCVSIDSQGVAAVGGRTNGTVWTTAGCLNATSNGGEDAVLWVVAPRGELAEDLRYASMFGGTASEIFEDVVWSGGDAYLAGSCSSAIPTTPDAYDSSYGGNKDQVLVVISPDGAGEDDLVYATVIGTADVEDGYGVDVDSDGLVVVCGSSSSASFPATASANQTANAGERDGTVIILNLSLSGADQRVACSYIGGDGADYCYSVAWGPGGYVVVGGESNSTDFPTTGDAWMVQSTVKEGFLTIFRPNLTCSLAYSTLVGGTGDIDRVWDVVVNSSWIVGLAADVNSADARNTTGAYQPATAGATDAFLMAELMDDTPPAVTGDLSDRTIEVGTSWTVQVNVTDPHLFPTGVVSVVLTFDGTNSSMWPDGGGIYSWGCSPGEIQHYAYYITAVDASGNVRQVGPMDLWVTGPTYGTPPEVRVRGTGGEEAQAPGAPEGSVYVWRPTTFWQHHGGYVLCCVGALVMAALLWLKWRWYGLAAGLALAGVALVSWLLWVFGACPAYAPDAVLWAYYTVTDAAVTAWSAVSSFFTDLWERIVDCFVEPPC